MESITIAPASENLKLVDIIPQDLGTIGLAQQVEAPIGLHDEFTPAEEKVSEVTLLLSMLGGDKTDDD